MTRRMSDAEWQYWQHMDNMQKLPIGEASIKINVDTSELDAAMTKTRELIALLEKVRRLRKKWWQFWK